MSGTATSKRLDQLIDISRALMSDSHVEHVVTRILEAGRLELMRWETDPEDLFAVALTRASGL